MDYFDEKSEQVTPDTLEAFGIKIQSRYGRARELREGLLFAEDLAEKGLHGFVLEVFFDSKADICSFSLGETDLFPQISQGILDCALEHISQFDWEGTVYHGKPLTFA